MFESAKYQNTKIKIGWTKWSHFFPLFSPDIQRPELRRKLVNLHLFVILWMSKIKWWACDERVTILLVVRKCLKCVRARNKKILKTNVVLPNHFIFSAHSALIFEWSKKHKNKLLDPNRPDFVISNLRGLINAPHREN